MNRFRQRIIAPWAPGEAEQTYVKITAEHLEQYHNEGFVVIPGFLDADKLAEAQAGIGADHPTPEDYFADPTQWPIYNTTQFTLLKFPFGDWRVNRLAFDPDMLDAAARALDADPWDVRFTKGELWAKYSGAIDYDQQFHRDFGNHTLVVPRADHRYKELTTFVFLSDVDETDGPTAVLPRYLTDQIPLGSRRLPNEATWRQHQKLATGPAGSLLMYSYDVFHRGTNLLGEGRSRFMVLLDYRHVNAPWIARQGWPDVGNHPRMAEAITRITPRDRCLFDIPPPGHEFWNEQTIADMMLRYEGIDMQPYRDAL
jgi:hypothetical protein